VKDPDPSSFSCIHRDGIGPESGSIPIVPPLTKSNDVLKHLSHFSRRYLRFHPIVPEIRDYNYTRTGFMNQK
jgi:hypothetical protein